MMKSKINKIVICGELYSQNYGDGVIAHCLAYACKQINPQIEIEHIDISLRSTYSSKDIKSTSMVSQLYFINLLGIFKRLVGWLTVRREDAKKQWLGVFESADLVIIGGGQLFMDYKLNFPVKMFNISYIVRITRCNVCCVACGVSSSWSWIGKFLFKKLLFSPNMKSIGVRDCNSNNNIIKHFPSLHNKIIQTSDPAIFVNDAYGIQKKDRASILGINIMHPDTLSKVVPGCDIFVYDNLETLWFELIINLTKKGYKIELFTNGDILDNGFLDNVLNRVGDENIKSITKPETPLELVETISKYDVIVAHRLHANIIAYSLGVPSVGLIWDDKVDQFGRQTKRSEFFIEPSEQNVKNVFEKVIKAFSQKFDNSALNSMKEDFILSLDDQIKNSI